MCFPKYDVGVISNAFFVCSNWLIDIDMVSPVLVEMTFVIVSFSMRVLFMQGESCIAIMMCSVTWWFNMFSSSTISELSKNIISFMSKIACISIPLVRCRVLVSTWMLEFGAGRSLTRISISMRRYCAVDSLKS